MVGVGDEGAALVRKRMYCLSLAGIENRKRVAGDTYINSAADKCVGCLLYTSDAADEQ